MPKINVTVDVRVIGQDSFRGLLNDAYELLDRIESGVCDPILIRTELDQIRDRHESSLKADMMKSSI